ncbi:hypothetical protein D030_0980B, partial [Vibrio parahaemolyticus AQ3810]
TFDISVEDITD